MSKKPSSRICEAFAARLKSVRLSRDGETQKTFAEKLGLEEATYGRYERGEVEPNLDTLVKLSKLTKKSLDYLLTGNEWFSRHFEAEQEVRHSDREADVA